MKLRKTYDLSICEKNRSSLSPQAFELYVKCFLMDLFDRIYNSFNSFKGFELVEFIFPNKNFKNIFEKSISEFMKIKKRYPELSIKDSYSLYMFPLDKLTPGTKSFQNQLRDMILKKCLSSQDLYYWLKGYKPDYYTEKIISNTIFNAYNNSRNIFSAMVFDVFYFAYLGVIRDSTPEFSRSKAGRRFHINEIIKLKNNDLEPVLFFSGGLGDVFNWEPDPFYQP